MREFCLSKGTQLVHCAMDVLRAPMAAGGLCLMAQRLPSSLMSWCWRDGIGSRGSL